MRIILSLICTVFFYSVLCAQDPQFTMSYSSLMDLNPAFAGSSGCSRVASGYRNQWPNISGTFVSSYLSYDQYVKGVTGGLGINYLGDWAGQGSMETHRVAGNYSYRLLVGREFAMAFGFQGAYVQKKLNWQLMGIQGMNKQVVTYGDYSAGVLGYSKRFYGGFSVFHLTQPDEGFTFSGSPLPMKYSAHFGMNIGNPDSLKQVSVSPSISYLQQQDFRSLSINVAIRKGNVVGGIGYRNGDAILPSVGFISRVLRVSYSYDLTVSKLGVSTDGTHEIALSYIFNRKHKPAHFFAFSSTAF